MTPHPLKAYVRDLEAQVKDLKSTNDNLTKRLQLLREHNAKLKIKLMEKEQEIKSLLLKQLDSGAVSGGLPSPVMDDNDSQTPNGLPSPSNRSNSAKRNGKKNKSPISVSMGAVNRSSTFNLLTADPENGFSDLRQSTTEVIVDGVQYNDYSEDEEEYDDSLEEKTELKMSTSSIPLSMVVGNRNCASCKKDIVGRAVRAGDLVYHKSCHDKLHLVGTI